TGRRASPVFVNPAPAAVNPDRAAAPQRHRRFHRSVTPDAAAQQGKPMSKFTRWLRPFSRAKRIYSPKPRCRERVRPTLESLEDRLLLSSDMTQLAMSLGVHSSGPTHLYLNFDGLSFPTIVPAPGTNVQPYQDFQGGINQTDQDIQDILFKTSEI